MNGTLSAAATTMNGVLHGDDRSYRGICTDTRALGEGELFFALRGPNFDGRDYVHAAGDMGAAGAVVATTVDDMLPQIEVKDPRLALGRLASLWREQHDLTVVGVTGSNGKTTVKELIRACLARRSPTIATKGNLNNDIGLPLMLARIEKRHRFGVFEMGANHAGEIAYLASLAKPNIVVLTNAAAAHLEGFGSVEGVAKAKAEILQDPARPQTAILNADDAYFDYWRGLAVDVRVLSFGLGPSADVRADEIVTGARQSRFRLHLPGADVAVELPLAGIHNVRNACAAAAVCHSLGIDAEEIKAGLADVRPVGGRLHALRGINGATLFDDSYNANPLSVSVAAEFLAQLPGENWLVLGDMKELGDEAATLHREVGAALRAAGIDRLFAVGDMARYAVEAFGECAGWYASVDALINDLADRIKAPVNVLVKGSRSMQMERVVAALREDAPARREA